jgi:hypothetical protein
MGPDPTTKSSARGRDDLLGSNKYSHDSSERKRVSHPADARGYVEFDFSLQTIGPPAEGDHL